MRILVTGGLGFIGSRIVVELLARGDSVVVVDCLHPQVHADDAKAREIRSLGVEVIVADIRDESTWRDVHDVDAVFHMAAETGTGQSMSEVVRYVDVNVRGTALLCEAIHRSDRIQRVFLPSSRAIYGEGRWHCGAHGDVVPNPRAHGDLAAGKFDPVCPVCSGTISPLPTTENTAAKPASIYASTKLAQEQLLAQSCSAVGRELRIARYQNVFGPGQSLGNPYTGVLAIFARQLIEEKTLNIFEDGNIARDFVHIDDVVRATIAIAFAQVDPGVINVGSATATTLIDVVEAFKSVGFRDVRYEITGDFRDGDIRHAVADTTKLRAIDAQRARPFDEAFREYALYLQSQLAHS